jgi:hypothetical protein
MRLMPNRPEPHHNLGQVFEAVAKLEDAIALYETAYAMDPQNPIFIGNLARARHKHDEKDPDVRRLLEELIVHDTRPNWVCWARNLLGHGKLGDYEVLPSEGETPVPTGAPPSTEPLPAPLPDLVDPRGTSIHALETETDVAGQN